MQKKISQAATNLKKTGFFHIFLGNTASNLVSFLSSIVLVRILSKEANGVFSYAWNLFSLLMLASGFGLSSGTLQIASEEYGDEAKARRTYVFALRAGTVANLCIGLVLLLVSLLVKLPIEGSNGLLLLMCLLPLPMFWVELQGVYLRARRKNQAYAQLNFLQAILLFVATMAGALLLYARGLVLGRYLALTLCAAFGWGVLRLPGFRGEALSRSPMRRDLVRISLISMCNNGLSQLLYLLDVFIIGLMIPQDTVVASYRTATILPTALSFIPSAVVAYIYPYFAERRNDAAWCFSHYKKVLLGMGAANLLISAVLIAAAPFIIRVGFGEAYLDAVPAFRVLSASYFFSGTFRIISGNLLVTQRKLKYNLYIAALSGVLNILGNILFIWLWGPVGAAVTTLLIVLVSGALSTGLLWQLWKGRAKIPAKGEK